MAFSVKITPRAERDLSNLHQELHAGDSRHARQWYFLLKAAILGLSAMPNRCPVTSENKRIRHLLYGKKPHVYRVIFRVNSKAQTVDILHVRHGARQRFKRTDLE